jgi:hypothetical protein
MRGLSMHFSRKLRVNDATDVERVKTPEERVMRIAECGKVNEVSSTDLRAGRPGLRLSTRVFCLQSPDANGFMGFNKPRNDLSINLSVAQATSD